MKKLFEKRFKPIETLIVIIIMAILISMISNRYELLIFKSRVNYAKSDVNNLSLLIRLYRIKENHYPPHLVDLINKGYLTLDEDMEKGKSKLVGENLLDIFDKPYRYDNMTGKIELSLETLEIMRRTE